MSAVLPAMQMPTYKSNHQTSASPGQNLSAFLILREGQNFLQIEEQVFLSI
jgi:hypothetical protein